MHRPLFLYKCNTTCGQCKINDPCDKVTDHCPSGCKSHWEGTKCNGEIEITFYRCGTCIYLIENDKVDVCKIKDMNDI